MMCCCHITLSLRLFLQLSSFSFKWFSSQCLVFCSLSYISCDPALPSGLHYRISINRATLPLSARLQTSNSTDMILFLSKTLVRSCVIENRLRVSWWKTQHDKPWWITGFYDCECDYKYCYCLGVDDCLLLPQIKWSSNRDNKSMWSEHENKLRAPDQTT